MTDFAPIESLDPAARLPLQFKAKRRGKAPRHLADLPLAERRALVTEAGMPAFRAEQLSRHYFTHFSRDAESMTDLPAIQRGSLTDLLLPELLGEVRTLTADGGDTVKTLWELFDGSRVETVLMAYPGRNTVCISSEVGCGMACPFCATGQMGLTRNLSTAEIVEQVRLAAKACEDGTLTGTPSRLSNVVFMGMGEPLANFRAVMDTVRRLTDPAPEGFGLSARSVVVSTVVSVVVSPVGSVVVSSVGSVVVSSVGSVVVSSVVRAAGSAPEGGACAASSPIGTSAKSSAGRTASASMRTPSSAAL